MACFMKWFLTIFRGTKVNLNVRKFIFFNVHCIELYWQFQIPFESILSDVDPIREHNRIKSELVHDLHKASSI